MLRFARIFHQSNDKPTDVTIIAKHTVNYRYSTGQGGAETVRNTYPAKSMQELDTVCKRVASQCGPAVEGHVGEVYQRHTDIEIEGIIDGKKVSKQGVSSLQEFALILKKFGVEMDCPVVTCKPV